MRQNVFSHPQIVYKSARYDIAKIIKIFLYNIQLQHQCATAQGPALSVEPVSQTEFGQIHPCQRKAR